MKPCSPSAAPALPLPGLTVTADPEPVAERTYETGTEDGEDSCGDTGSTRDIGPTVDKDRTSAPAADPGFGTSLFDMGGPAAARAPAASAPAGDLPVRDRERYEFGDEHARGGLGKIMLAHDRELDRKVAVKELLRQGNTAQARFVREAMITARLEHPAIVPVHEAGRWLSGEPFYAMKLVAGRSLSEVIKDTSTLEERLALLPNIIAVADAIAYAHSELVIHRDLKPSNVMVGAYGETVVIDWGLAKDLARPDEAADLLAGPYRVPANDGLTEVGVVIGTPAYMPPEQADGLPVDERADVYALGAMLYHLLSGVAPYAASSSRQALAAVLEGPPEPIEDCASGIPVDLAAIVGKAMARELKARYRTAEELAEDLKRFQNGRLVEAHHYSRAQLVRRWVSRRRGVVTASAVALLVVILVVAFSFQRVLEQRDLAQKSAHSLAAERNKLILVQAENSLEQDPTATLAWIATYPLSGNAWNRLRDVAADAASRGVARHVLHGHEQGVLSAWDIPGTKLLLTASADRTVILWDTEARTSLQVADALGESSAVAVSPKGDLIGFANRANEIIVVELSGFSRRTLGQHPAGVGQLKFSPSGEELLSSGDDGSLRLWALPLGAHRDFVGHTKEVLHVSFSPDGEYFASCGMNGSAWLWHVGEVTGERIGDCGWYIGFAAQRNVVAFDEPSGTVHVLDVATHRHHRLSGLDVVNSQVRLSPTGDRVAAADNSGRVLVWSIATSEIVAKASHPDSVASVAFSGDGRLFASGDKGGRIELRNLQSGSKWELLGHTDSIFSLAFSSDEEHLLSGSGDSTVRVWSLPPGGAERMQGHTGSVFSAVFSPDGRLIATDSHDGTVKLWSANGELVRTLVGHESLVFGLSFSEDSRRLASASWDGTVRIWETATGESKTLRGHEGAVRGVAISHGGEYVASAGADGTVRLWRASDGRAVKVWHGHQDEARRVVFSPASTHVVSAGEDGTVRFWAVGEGEARVAKVHSDTVTAVRYSRNGKWLASWGKDGRVVVFNGFTFEQEATFNAEGLVYDTCFSSDERFVFAATAVGSLHMWELSTGAETVLIRYRSPLVAVRSSNDDSMLAIGGIDGTLQLLSMNSQGVTVLREHRWGITGLSFSPDAQFVVTASHDQTARLWQVRGRDETPSERRQLLSWIAAQTTAEIGPDSTATTRTVPRVPN